MNDFSLSTSIPSSQNYSLAIALEELSRDTFITPACENHLLSQASTHIQLRSFLSVSECDLLAQVWQILKRQEQEHKRKPRSILAKKKKEHFIVHLGTKQHWKVMSASSPHKKKTVLFNPIPSFYSKNIMPIEEEEEEKEKEGKWVRENSDNDADVDVDECDPKDLSQASERDDSDGDTDVDIIDSDDENYSLRERIRKIQMQSNNNNNNTTTTTTTPIISATPITNTSSSFICLPSPPSNQKQEETLTILTFCNFKQKWYPLEIGNFIYAGSKSSPHILMISCINNNGNNNNNNIQISVQRCFTIDQIPGFIDASQVLSCKHLILSDRVEILPNEEEIIGICDPKDHFIFYVLDSTSQKVCRSSGLIFCLYLEDKLLSSSDIITKKLLDKVSSNNSNNSNNNNSINESVDCTYTIELCTFRDFVCSQDIFMWQTSFGSKFWSSTILSLISSSDMIVNKPIQSIFFNETNNNIIHKTSIEFIKGSGHISTCDLCHHKREITHVLNVYAQENKDKLLSSYNIGRHCKDKVHVLSLITFSIQNIRSDYAYQMSHANSSSSAEDKIKYLFRQQNMIQSFGSRARDIVSDINQFYIHDQKETTTTTASV